MAAHFLTNHPNLNQMSCALVHASALPLIGVVPGCLAALVSLVRLVVAAVFCLVSAIVLPALMAFVPYGHRNFEEFEDFQVGAQAEVHLSVLFLVRSLLSVVSGGFYGFGFEQLSKENYARAVGFSSIQVPYEGYKRPIWFA